MVESLFTQDNYLIFFPKFYCTKYCFELYICSGKNCSVKIDEICKYSLANIKTMAISVIHRQVDNLAYFNWSLIAEICVIGSYYFQIYIRSSIVPYPPDIYPLFLDINFTKIEIFSDIQCENVTVDVQVCNIYDCSKSYSSFYFNQIFKDRHLEVRVDYLVRIVSIYWEFISSSWCFNVSEFLVKIPYYKYENYTRVKKISYNNFICCRKLNVSIWIKGDSLFYETVHFYIFNSTDYPIRIFYSNFKNRTLILSWDLNYQFQSYYFTNLSFPIILSHNYVKIKLVYHAWIDSKIFYIYPIPFCRDVCLDLDFTEFNLKYVPKYFTANQTGIQQICSEMKFDLHDYSYLYHHLESNRIFFPLFKLKHNLHVCLDLDFYYEFNATSPINPLDMVEHNIIQFNSNSFLCCFTICHYYYFFSYRSLITSAYDNSLKVYGTIFKFDKLYTDITFHEIEINSSSKYEANTVMLIKFLYSKIGKYCDDTYKYIFIKNITIPPYNMFRMTTEHFYEKINTEIKRDLSSYDCSINIRQVSASYFQHYNSKELKYFFYQSFRFFKIPFASIFEIKMYKYHAKFSYQFDIEFYFCNQFQIVLNVSYDGSLYSKHLLEYLYNVPASFVVPIKNCQKNITIILYSLQYFNQFNYTFFTQSVGADDIRYFVNWTRVNEQSDSVQFIIYNVNTCNVGEGFYQIAVNGIKSEWKSGASNITKITFVSKKNGCNKFCVYLSLHFSQRFKKYSMISCLYTLNATGLIECNGIEFYPPYKIVISWRVNQTAFKCILSYYYSIKILTLTGTILSENKITDMRKRNATIEIVASNCREICISFELRDDKIVLFQRKKCILNPKIIISKLVIFPEYTYLVMPFNNILFCAFSTSCADNITFQTNVDPPDILKRINKTHLSLPMNFLLWGKKFRIYCNKNSNYTFKNYEIYFPRKIIPRPYHEYYFIDLFDYELSVVLYAYYRIFYLNCIPMDLKRCCNVKEGIIRFKNAYGRNATYLLKCYLNESRSFYVDSIKLNTLSSFSTIEILPVKDELWFYKEIVICVLHDYYGDYNHFIFTVFYPFDFIDIDRYNITTYIFHKNPFINSIKVCFKCGFTTPVERCYILHTKLILKIDPYYYIYLTNYYNYTITTQMIDDENIAYPANCYSNVAFFKYINNFTMQFIESHVGYQESNFTCTLLYAEYKNYVIFRKYDLEIKLIIFPISPIYYYTKSKSNLSCAVWPYFLNITENQLYTNDTFNIEQISPVLRFKPVVYLDYRCICITCTTMDIVKTSKCYRFIGDLQLLLEPNLDVYFSWRKDTVLTYYLDLYSGVHYNVTCIFANESYIHYELGTFRLTDTTPSRLFNVTCYCPDLKKYGNISINTLWDQVTILITPKINYYSQYFPLDLKCNILPHRVAHYLSAFGFTQINTTNVIKKSPRHWIIGTEKYENNKSICVTCGHFLLNNLTKCLKFFNESTVRVIVEIVPTDTIIRYKQPHSIKCIIRPEIIPKNMIVLIIPELERSEYYYLGPATISISTGNQHKDICVICGNTTYYNGSRCYILDAGSNQMTIKIIITLLMFALFLLSLYIKENVII